MSRCARCDAEISCGATTGACWCASLEVPQEVLEALSVAYRGCLCPQCLDESRDAMLPRT